MTLNVTVKNRIATYVSGQGIPVCGNTGDQVKFTFDEEWSQHETKTARFKWGGKVFDQEFTGNICEIPNIDNTDSITVGVFVGEEENGEDELSTTDTRIPYRRSTRCGNNIPHGESGESYTNLAKGYAASAKADADRAEAAARAGGGSYVLELTAESGTLTDEQYNAVVANAPNVVASLAGELIFPYKGYYAGNNEHQFEIVTQQTGGEDGSTIVSLYLTIEADKSYSMRVTESQLASKTYVDNAVANAGGGGSSDSCEIYVAYYPDATNTLTIKTASEFWLEQHGAKPTIITQIVDTLPTVLKEVDEENLILYAYILKSTGVGYLGIDGTTITLGQLVFNLDGFDKGWTTDINSVSDLGVYCVRTQGNSNAGGGIIDVTELPTEGIDEQSIYRLENVGANVYMLMEDNGNKVVMLLAELISMDFGAPVTVNTQIVEVLPDTITKSDVTNGFFYLYIIASTGIAYGDIGNGTQSLGLAIGGDESANRGWSTDPYAETELGFYCVKTYAYTYHACKDGVWTELSNSVSGARGGVIYIQLEATDGLLSPASGTLTDEQYATITADPKNIAIDMIDSYDNPSHLILPCAAWVTGNKYLYKSFEANEKYLFTYLLTVNSDKTWGYTIVLKEL